VVVLAGGSSAEREVSLRSGEAVHAAAAQQGLAAELALVPMAAPLALGRLQAGAALRATAGSQHPVDVLSAAMTASRPPIVFTTLHGAAGENGTWQGLLELLNVPYVSCGVRGSAVAMDKLLTKRIASQLGIRTPRWWVVRRGREHPRVPEYITELVVKPVAEGSSVGVCMTENSDTGWTAVAELSRQYDPLLVEQRIRGRELTLAVIGHAQDPIVLPLIEIKPRRGFYDYERKYTAGASDYECPAEVDPAVAGQIASDALKLYSELDLGPMSRFDILLDTEGRSWFLEVNTLPGFTETSLVPKAASAAGIDFDELLQLLMLCAVERWEGRQRAEEQPC
jgi:D-alanine-D-alanine ligase